MEKLKELYKKYYYISPLDQADFAESNRLMNLYWSGICFFVVLAFLVLELVFKREYYREHRFQIIYMAGACVSISLSFVLSRVTKNVPRQKAYILKTLPFYVIYCWCGTTCPIMLFYNQANHYNGLIVFLCATNIVLCIFTASLPLFAIIIVSCAAMVPGVVRFFGPYGTFNYTIATLIIFTLFFINRYKLKQHLALIKKQKNNLEAKTFGNFTLLYENKAVKFSRSKTLELIAYLIVKNGSSANTKELLCVLYGDYADSARYGSSLRALISDARHIFSEMEIQNFFTAEYNSFRINPEAIKCDYYDFLSGDSKAIKGYAGEFMSQYSWAEDTAAFLSQKALSK